MKMVGTRRMVAILALGWVSAVAISSPAHAQVADTEQEQKLIEVAQRVPQFGGYFLDAEKGQLVVYLTQGGDQVVDAFRKALEAVYSPGDLAGAPLDNIVAREASYSWLQLTEWFNRLRADPFADVQRHGIDSFTNRLRIGVEDPEGQRSAIEDYLARVGIPSEAVNVESAKVTLLGENAPSTNRQEPAERGWWVWLLLALVPLALIGAFILRSRIGGRGLQFEPSVPEAPREKVP